MYLYRGEEAPVIDQTFLQAFPPDFKDCYRSDPYILWWYLASEIHKVQEFPLYNHTPILADRVYIFAKICLRPTKTLNLVSNWHIIAF